MHPEHTDLLALGLPHPIVDVGRSVRESFFMLWDTLWALVFGFALSGAVQVFVSRRSIRRHLGDHRPASVIRASLYGAASSSCSYAASAMARSLFVGGADFLAAMVFMFASTNLVIELGVVLVVLVGWQFVAAELLGGIVMIVLVVLFGGLWLRGRVLLEARAVAVERGVDAGGRGADHDHDHGHGPGPDAGPAPGAVDEVRDRRRMRSAGGWADAASATMGDLTMLWREMAVGFVIAGFLSVLVPVHVWSDVFVRGHGVWTSLENAAVGPLVAVVTFVCSVGNVPLAAALWTGGISFGGVVAFLFADLIAMPLLLVYRRQYGGRVALRLLWVFWLAMSSAGLATGSLFEAAGWVPDLRRGAVAGDVPRWDWTSFLDIAALLGFCALAWLSRNRTRLGGRSGYAEDPVCRMQVEAALAPASAVRDGRRVYFCSERCRDRFVAGPDPTGARELGGPSPTSVSATSPGALTRAGLRATSRFPPRRRSRGRSCGV